MSEPIVGEKGFIPGQIVYEVEWYDGQNPMVEPLVFLYYVTTSHTRVRKLDKSDDFKFSRTTTHLFPTAREAVHDALKSYEMHLENLKNRDIPRCEDHIRKIVDLLDSLPD